MNNEATTNETDYYHNHIDNNKEQATTIKDISISFIIYINLQSSKCRKEWMENLLSQFNIHFIDLML